MFPAINQAKQVISVVRQSGNLPAVLQQLAQSNPQMQQAMNIINSGGTTNMLYELARQRGIDPNELIEMLK